MKMPIINGLKLSQDFDPIAGLQLRIAYFTRFDFLQAEASRYESAFRTFT